jgi:prevent-host-death family protein
MQFSKYSEDVVTTRERVTITKNGKPAAVLISTESRIARGDAVLGEQDSVDEQGPSVGVDAVVSDLESRRRRTG